MQQFKPPKSFRFPKRKFGKKGEERSFRAAWCEKYDWLHYDVSADAAFCYLCMQAEHQKKFLASKKREPAFITKGFTYWKEATTAFNQHQLSATHLEAVESLVLLPSQIQGDIGEILSHEHEEEKGTNRKMFLLILEVIRFLVRQGLPLRGNDDDAESNFIQLLHLHGKHCAPQNIHHWLSKKTNKYTSHEIQNECIQIMALHILCEVSERIASAGFFALMADECTDCSNREQFTINIRWVDASLQDNVAFIGLYAVDAINANCLVSAIKDVLIRMNLKLSCCRGQCYDGASNMSGIKSGVAAQLCAEEKRALFTHCYCHALNLAIGDTIKQSKVCKNALDVAFEITKLVKFSPKRNILFDKIRSECEEESSIGIRTFCPTRWTVRGDSIESILVNYNTLNQLWEECLTTNLQPDVKGRIIGVKSQMCNFDVLFGLKLCERILKITDNLSKTLQKQSLSAAEAQHIIALSVTTLEKMRTADNFSLFYKVVLNLQDHTNTDSPILPRKRRAPQHLEVGESTGYHSSTVEELYRRYYYEALDNAVSTIKNRFNQPGYIMYCNIENLLTKAANQQDFSTELQKVTDFYGDDLDTSSLSVQLTNFASHFIGSTDTVTLQDCLEYLRSLSEGGRSFYSEVCQVVKLLLVMPATNAYSERSFSVMRRLKTYLRSTMGQARLNHIMLLHIYKAQLDGLDLSLIANDFVCGNEHRLSYFGKFS